MPRGSSSERFSWKREVAIGLGFYAVYLLVRRAGARRGRPGAGRAQRREDRRARGTAGNPRRAGAPAARAAAPATHRRAQRRLRDAERRPDRRLADGAVSQTRPRVSPLSTSGGRGRARRAAGVPAVPRRPAAQARASIGHAPGGERRRPGFGHDRPLLPSARGDAEHPRDPRRRDGPRHQGDERRPGRPGARSSLSTLRGGRRAPDGQPLRRRRHGRQHPRARSRSASPVASGRGR